MPRLVEPLEVVRGVRAPSRVLFGPHVTNLGERRAISARHVAYYRERAAGGTGMLVTETASVHPDDHPYERAPLAADCGPGWTDVVAACREFGTVVLAGLGHAGGQGSSAYSRTVLWGPSRVPDPVSRELPAEMEQPQIDEVVSGFADAAALAVRSGLAGVEIDAGAVSLLRQFQSGLTNLRSDAYGRDRLLLTRQVLAAVRRALGEHGVLGLRLSGDERAPWAGITPHLAAQHVRELSGSVDLLTVVRGGPFSVDAYRPDAHTPPMVNRDLTRHLRAAAAGRTLVVLQGSVVDLDAAQGALEDGTADAVEMTRRQIAEPRLVNLLRAGTPERARPCVLCNQACQVHDVANPLVSCVGEPRSGYEWAEPVLDGAPVEGRDRRPVPTLVVGGGPAGLEAARVLALRGHPVRLLERTAALGGVLRRAAVGPGRERLALLPEWLESEARRLGVAIELDREATAADLDEAATSGDAVILATGSHPAPQDRPGAAELAISDPVDVLVGGAAAIPAGPVVVRDTVGGPVGVGVAEWLAANGRSVTLVSPDPVVGARLSPTGDLSGANSRLAAAGVARETRALLRRVDRGEVELEDVWTGRTRLVPCGVLIDCGPRVPEDRLHRARPATPRAGDCVAPRTVLEAIREGRRQALTIGAPPSTHRHPMLIASGEGVATPAVR